MFRSSIAGGTIGLLVLGLISTALSALISSGRLSFVPTKEAIAVISFVQLEAVVLTAAKLGIDGVILAQAGAWRGRRLDIRKHHIRKSVPISLLAGVAWIHAGGWLASTLLCASVIADVESSALYAKSAGNNRLDHCVVAALVNYPLFFLSSLVIWALHADPAWLFAGFFATSLLRLAYLKRQEQYSEDLEPWSPHVDGAIAVYQLLNYWLFRADQVLLASTALGTPAGDRLGYFFLCRLTDGLGSASATAGPALHPALYESAVTWRRFRRLLIPLLILSGIGVLTIFHVYALLLPVTSRPSAFVISCVALASLWIAPTNFVTYAILRRSRTTNLIRCGVFASALGAIAAGVYLVTDSLPALAMVILLQLTAYTVSGGVLVTRKSA